MKEKKYKRFDFTNLISPFINTNISFDHVNLENNILTIVFLDLTTNKYISNKNVQLHETDLLYIYNMIYMDNINSLHN
jgi:hypothetical protein